MPYRLSGDSGISGGAARARELSRRALVAAVPGLALGALGGEAVTASSTHPAATPLARRFPPPRHTSPVVHTAHPAPTRPVHAKPVQAKPVRTLADYRKVVPGPAFPPHAVALTIDDGPHPVWTPLILKLLDQYHVPATFFMIGAEARGHASVARSVVAAGHGVANHTWTHPATFKHYPADKIRQQISLAQDMITTVTHQTPKLFRSPGGDSSKAMLAEVAHADLVFIDWSVDPRDWAKPGTGTVISRLLAARPGQILLCHDGGGDRSQTYQALRTVLPALRSRGYAFVAL